jgi:hypothetical protein
VEIGSGRSRGWIDILAYHAATRTLLVVEVKTELRDMGALLRTVAWYERAAWSAARARGWRPTSLGSATLFLATAANDSAIRDNADLMASGFPIRAVALETFLRDPASVGLSGRALAMIDPLSRRRNWLRRTRLDGRRTPAPAPDYATVARALRSRGRSPRRPAGPT